MNETGSAHKISDRPAAHLGWLLDAVANGDLAPPVGQSFAFEDFAEAMTFALSGNAIGKPVIQVGPEPA